MATKWFEMGLQLSVNPKTLKTIQHDTRNSKVACREMFTEWLDNATNVEKSWKKVLEALCSQSVGENTLAKNLRHLEESFLETAHHKLAKYSEKDNNDAVKKITTSGEDKISEHCSMIGPNEADDGNRSNDSKKCLSVHVPCGITQSIHTIFIYLRPDTAECTDNQKDIKLKDELDEVRYKYKMIVNQVKLIGLLELLIEKSKKFSDTLSEVLKLYVKHFKSKKKANCSSLSQSELIMVNIIETVTECTENIDMNKELESWEQCLSKMHEQLKGLKKALYSINHDEMERIQKGWSLNGDKVVKAHGWIDERRKVIEASKNSLTKLEQIYEGDKESEVTKELAKNILQAVQGRILVGESCLKAWINWIDHRTNLCK